MAENNGGNDRKGKSLEDYAKMMGVKESELRDALRKFGLDKEDLVNQQKRGVLADAIEQKWSKDRFKANYDARVAESADFDWQEIVSQYGYSLGVLREYKDQLKPIFQWLAKKLQKGESIENLRAEFNERVGRTEFGRRTSDEINADLMRYDKQKKEDWRKVVGDLAKEVRRVAQGKYGDSILRVLEGSKGRDLAIQLIYDDNAFLNGNFDSEKILRAVEPLWRNNSSDTQPDSQPGAQPGTVTGGDAGNYETQLNTWLSRNGVSMDSLVLKDYLDKLLNKNWTMEQVKQDIRNTKFTRLYSGYEKFFAQGQDVSDIALDFRQAAAGLLEQSIDSIGIDNLLVQKALQHKGADGKPAPMALYEFEREVRRSPEWDKTDNAMRTYTDIGETILRNFGFRG